MNTITAVANTRRRMDAGGHQQLLDDYHRHLKEIGLSPVSLAINLGSVKHFLTWITLDGVGFDAVGRETVEKFAQHKCNCHGAPRPLGKWYINRVHRFVRYLATISVIPSFVESELPDTNLHVSKWLEWLACHRGLATVTIERHSRMLAQILPLLGEDPKHYSAQCIRDALYEHARISRSRHYPKMVASALRGYLRHLSVVGAAVPDLDRAVFTPKQWRLASLPRYIAPKVVNQLVESCDITTSMGMRDKAILLLLARLGLRARDVAELRLSDIDWTSGNLRICGKGRRIEHLPLPQDAGEALIDYLTHVRPQASTDVVFLRHLPPFIPFATSSTISAVVDRALTRVGVENAPSRGTNFLRHSAATAMLRGGASLEAIGTVLRHRSVDTTAHYAKVDISMLGEITQNWPEIPCTSTQVCSRTHDLEQLWPGALPC